MLKPVVELGPSLRFQSGVLDYGLTTGIGVAAKWKWATFTPQLRYTKWQSNPTTSRKPDEIDLLVGITF